MKRMLFREVLQGGDRRSIGDSNRVATLVLKNPRRFTELVRCFWSDDPLVRMRAADAAEKISVRKPALLAKFKAELLGLADEAIEAELRWHLALMLPRCPLTRSERNRLRSILKRYLTDRSSIVKTSALQSMAELTKADAALQAEVIDLLEEAARTGTPAMKARSRKLLQQLGKSVFKRS